MDSSTLTLSAVAATFYFLLSIGIAVSQTTRPSRAIGKWKSVVLSTLIGSGAGFSIVLIGLFCVARGYPSRIDIYVLAVSVVNSAFYLSAILAMFVRSFSSIRAKP